MRPGDEDTSFIIVVANIRIHIACGDNDYSDCGDLAVNRRRFGQQAGPDVEYVLHSPGLLDDGDSAGDAVRPGKMGTPVDHHAVQDSPASRTDFPGKCVGGGGKTIQAS